MSFNILIALSGILAGFYALPYANWELNENKNKISAITIYIIALIGVFLSVFQNFL